MARPRIEGQVVEVEVPLAIEPAIITPMRLLALRAGLAGGLAVGTVLMHGFYDPPLPRRWVHTMQALLLLILAVERFWHSRRRPWPSVDGERDLLAAALIPLGLASIVEHLLVHDPWGWWVVDACAVALFIIELWRLNVAAARRLARPGVLMPLSFLTLIALGASMLKLPVCIPPGSRPLSWLDAVFEATSAVCVTGLVVRDTYAGFTPLGRGVLLLFIQLGGLGMIIYGSTIAMLLGRRLSLRENVNLSRLLMDQPLHRLKRFTLFIVLTTFAIEAVGAAMLYPMWSEAIEGPLTRNDRLGLSVFHAISAFCNAGFDITAGDSLVDYRYALPTHAVVGPLIVLGGLGFPVIEDIALAGWARLGRRFSRVRISRRDIEPSLPRRLSLHTRIVLVTSAALYLYGFVATFIAQMMPHFYERLGLGQTAGQIRPGPLTVSAAAGLAADANFLSLTARTAGFNAMPMDALAPGSVFTLITLMFVGGSPGGTAGGVKTTVLAVLVLSILGSLKQARETEAFHRTISDAAVKSAGTLAMCFATAAAAALLLLTLWEPAPFIALAFEVVSALGTVGLSLGITGDLTAAGKGVLIVVMFLGRIGPLALLGSVLLREGVVRPWHYPHEEVALG